MDESIKKFIEFYGENMPEEVYLVKNTKRYNEVMEAIQEILQFAKDTDKKARSKVRIDELTGTSICFTITTELIIIDMMNKFCNAIKKASNMEICQRADNKFDIGFVFEDVFYPAEPYKEE